ncbi:MAG: hypothetical protein IKC65_00005, partial [Lentisphaeria bacterium]|nr:hypothetical protein [Lentisphaeria bacterium]
DDVSKELSLLVAADPAAAGGKLNKARKYGIKIVSLEEFLAMPGSAPQEKPEPLQETAVQGELF